MNAQLAVCGVAVALVSVAAAARGSGKTVLEDSAPGRDAYALVLGGHWMSTNQSVEEMESLHDRFGGDLLWVLRRGEAYVVRDRARLEEARGLFAALRALEPEQKDLARRQQRLDRREDALDREREELEEPSGDEDGADRDPSAGRRMRELDAERGKIEAESRRLDAEENALDRRSDELEKAAVAKLWLLVDRWIADGTARPVSER